MQQFNRLLADHQKSDEKVLKSVLSQNEVPNSKVIEIRFSQNMSDSVEVLEITDTSITTEALSELKEIVSAAPSLLEATTKTKRQLEDDDDLEERSAKKICADIEDVEEEEVTVSYRKVKDGAGGMAYNFVISANRNGNH